MAYQRSLAVAAVCLAVLLVGCASSTSQTVARDVQAGAPERAALRLQLASAYYAQGQLDVALAEAQQAVQLAPNDAQAYGVRALILAAQRHTASSL